VRAVGGLLPTPPLLLAATPAVTITTAPEKSDHKYYQHAERSCQMPNTPPSQSETDNPHKAHSQTNSTSALTNVIAATAHVHALEPSTLKYQNDITYTASKPVQFNYSHLQPPPFAPTPQV